MKYIEIDYNNPEQKCFDGQEYIFTWKGQNYFISHWTGEYFAFGNGYHEGNKPFTHYADFEKYC